MPTPSVGAPAWSTGWRQSTCWCWCWHARLPLAVPEACTWCCGAAIPGRGAYDNNICSYFAVTYLYLQKFRLCVLKHPFFFFFPTWPLKTGCGKVPNRENNLSLLMLFCWAVSSFPLAFALSRISQTIWPRAKDNSNAFLSPFSSSASHRKKIMWLSQPS